MIQLSKVYEKSVSSKYKRYFEQTSKFRKSFRRYSLDSHRIVSTHSGGFHPWETGEAGVPIGWLQAKNEIIVDHTDSHTLVIGPTGSKKSRLVAMPLIRILGGSKESMIVSDPKAELYNRTSGYLAQQGYEISVLNLRSPAYGNCWNPLAIPYSFFCNREIDRAYEFVNDIAENLIQTGKSNSEPFWDDSAGSLFFGLTVLLFKYCSDNNVDSKHVHIGNVVKLRDELFSKSKGGKDSWLWRYAKTDHIISSALIGTVETADVTREGILSGFDQKVRGFSIQPSLLDMLSASDITLDAIGQKPTAIFLLLPDEKTGYHGLVSLFVKQSYEYIIFKAQQESDDDGLHVGKLENRVNYVLDEFSSLPTVNDFPAMITASRSRNIRFTLIIQSKHQLLQRYKEETETIQTNCGNWLFLTSRELRLLEEISSLCGKTSEDNPKPVLSVAALQRLDKDAGEVLLLSGRSLPYITHLPDIKIYDNDCFSSCPILPRGARVLPLLDFKPALIADKVQDDNSKLRKKVDVEALLKKLDKKMEQFEEEEGQTKKEFAGESGGAQGSHVYDEVEGDRGGKDDI